MSYAEQADLYRNPQERARIEACVAEQAHLTYADDADPANAALADAVIRGEREHLEALVLAVSVGPNSATISDDAALLGATQEAWGRVGQAFVEEPV